MKRRLVGGLILLNLCVISLNLSAGEQDITDNDVLDQLVGLREYIDEKRDFTKESKGLKPVLVQYRSNASKIDGIAQCNLSFNTDALHLSIGGYSVQADGTPITLTINVVYEWTEYIGYTIKSAKLNATKSLPVFEEITDADGHKRFIEGNGGVETGITASYQKWSLSGTHLMLVLAGQIDANTSFSYDDIVAEFWSIPAWVLNKIYATYSSVVLDIDSYGTNSADWGDTIAIKGRLVKFDTGLRILANQLSNLTDKVYNFRIQLDLLVDNE